MNNVFIRKEELNTWIAKYFPTKDLISIDDLIGVIEDLDYELDVIKEKEEQEKNDYPEEEKDREREVLGI